MKNLIHVRKPLLLSIAVLFLTTVVSGQDDNFKAGVFIRKIKKAHATARSTVSRIPAKAVEANERGNSSFDEGKYEEAIAAYQEAISLYQRYAEAYANLGDARRELKRYEQAVAAYQVAIRLKPNYGDAYNGLADTYEAMGRNADAEAARNRGNASYGSGGVMNAKAITLGRPSYPAAAKAAKVSGKVEVRVLIDETGQVIRAEAISGPPLLRGAAVMAASQSTFTPTSLGGQPVKVSGVIVYNFVM
jgi:TonB family protein